MLKKIKLANNLMAFCDIIQIFVFGNIEIN